MKKIKLRYQKSDESKKKTVLKFRDHYDYEIDEEANHLSGKRRKDEGKRMHRPKTIKENFSDDYS